MTTFATKASKIELFGLTVFPIESVGNRDSEKTKYLILNACLISLVSVFLLPDWKILNFIRSVFDFSILILISARKLREEFYVKEAITFLFSLSIRFYKLLALFLALLIWPFKGRIIRNLFQP